MSAHWNPTESLQRAKWIWFISFTAQWESSLASNSLFHMVVMWGLGVQMCGQCRKCHIRCHLIQEEMETRKKKRASIATKILRSNRVHILKHRGFWLTLGHDHSVHKTDIFILSVVSLSFGIDHAAPEICSQMPTFKRSPSCPSTLQAEWPAVWAGGTAGTEDSALGTSREQMVYGGYLQPEDRGLQIAGSSGSVRDCRWPGGMRTPLQLTELQCVLQQHPSVLDCQVEICWGPIGCRTPCLWVNTPSRLLPNHLSGGDRP